MIIFIVGFVGGIVFLGILVYFLMPKMMIVSKRSKYDFYETIHRLEQSIQLAGWSHKGTEMISEEIKGKTGQDFEHKIAGVKLCKASYAKDILNEESSRFVSSLMPCSISVWESDKGVVHVSKMNTGLMGKIFGGKIADVMGGKVGPEEEKMLADIIV